MAGNIADVGRDRGPSVYKYYSNQTGAILSCPTPGLSKYGLDYIHLFPKTLTGNLFNKALILIFCLGVQLYDKNAPGRQVPNFK